MSCIIILLLDEDRMMSSDVFVFPNPPTLIQNYFPPKFKWENGNVTKKQLNK